MSSVRSDATTSTWRHRPARPASRESTGTGESESAAANAKENSSNVDWQPYSVSFDNRSKESELQQPQFPQAGETLAGCKLLADLAKGAHGRVFLAIQLQLADRPVVLKVTPCDGQEHLSLARLFHAHVVPLLFAQDYPERNIRVLGMPYLGGGSLTQLMQLLEPVPAPARTGQLFVDALDHLQATTPFPAAACRGPGREVLAHATYVDAVCWLGGCLADGLHFAHERELLHLDLKPDNVLIAADGQPLLLDFHLARPPIAKGAAPPPWFGGTPTYMPPEQRQAFAAVKARHAIPAAVDARADVFALGAILFELLGGTPPTEGQRVSRTLRTLNPEVTQGVSDIIAKCLAHKPEDRYGDARSLAVDLRCHLAQLPLRGVTNRSLSERYRKWRLRRPHGLAPFGTWLLFAAVFFMMLVFIGFQAESRRAAAEQALGEGQVLLARERHVEAEETFAQGLVYTRYFPWSDSLRIPLDQGRLRARAYQAAAELAGLVETLRFLHDPDSIPIATVNHLIEECECCWNRRQELEAYIDQKFGRTGRDQFHANLLELAILWSDLRSRTAAPDDRVRVHRWAVDLLQQADEWGPSPALTWEISRHRETLGMQAVAVARPTVPVAAMDHFAFGRCQMRDRNLDAALASFTCAAEGQPDSLWPHFYQGVCAYRLGRNEEAVGAFGKCIVLAPKSGVCYFNRGLGRAAMTQYAKACADFDKAIHLDPQMAPAWLERGLCHFHAKDYKAALQDLNESLARGTDPATVHYNLALIRDAQKDRDQAILELRTALAARPNHEASSRLLARLQAAFEPNTR